MTGHEIIIVAKTVSSVHITLMVDRVRLIRIKGELACPASIYLAVNSRGVRDRILFRKKAN
jgi:hypothetical protein